MFHDLQHYLRQFDLQKIGLTQIPRIMSMIRPLDEIQGPSQLQNYNMWLVCEVT
jgi:hypothetical protein